jgi:creatinine amidohydrolase
MKWEELSSTRLGAMSRKSVCIMPLGAIEQHGPHLPVMTDWLIATSLAAQLDARFDGKLLVMPGPVFGCSDHHMAFAGTLSLLHETFRASVMESLDAAVAHGFARFLLLNAHGGNASIGGVIAEQASRRWPKADVVFATWFRLAAERLRPLVQGEYPAVGHACEFETSMMLALRPDLVDMSLARDDGIPQSPSQLRGDLLRGGGATRALAFDRISESGVFGKPTLATADKGRQIIDIALGAFEQLLRETWPDAPGIAGRGGEA